MHEILQIKGTYTVICHGPDGLEKWRDVFENLVTTQAKNYMLDNFLAGSAFTQTGPFMGLISSTSFSAVSAADTAASHAGWLEAGGSNAPTYSGNRKTCVWSAASGGAKALSVALVFSATGSGTVKGGAIWLGASAVNTKDDANGILWCAGLFAGGDKVVSSGDTLSISYTSSL